LREENCERNRFKQTTRGSTSYSCTVEMKTLFFIYFSIGLKVKLCSFAAMPIGFAIETKK
jgi:hypothetical protein